MKKRFFTLTLALMMCLALLQTGVFAAELQAVTIKIPGCDAEFTLNGVSEQYVLTEREDSGIPVYRFAFPGTAGKVICNMTAGYIVGETWEDADPAKSGFGGGEYDPRPAGWSAGYSDRWLNLNGRGLNSVELSAYDDGTLVYGSDKAVVAYIEFFFGYPVSYGGGGMLPEDLISWGWTPRMMSSSELVHMDLPKHPVSGLAVTPAPEKPSTWAAEQVNAAIAAGLVPEALQSKYAQATTRAEFCALAVELYETVMGKEIATDKSIMFTDTMDTNVYKAASIGVVNGTNAELKLFSPDANLSREQAATMLSRLADAMEYNVALTQEFIIWTDEGSISGFASSAVQFVYKIGVMNGTDTNMLRFSPKAPYTREQSIVTIMRLFDVVK